MKIIKYVLIFVGFGLAGTILATFFAPKNHIVVHNVIINQPLEQCWDAAFNPTIIPNWRDNLDSVETVSGVYDETGYKAHFVFSDAEQISKPTYELDSVFDKESATSSIVLNDKIRLDTKYVFKAVDSVSTELKVTTTLTPSGWMYKVMFAGAGNGLEVKRQAELDNLKKWLENQTTTPSL